MKKISISNLITNIKENRKIYFYTSILFIFSISLFIMNKNSENIKYQKNRNEAIESGLKPIEVISGLNGKSEAVNLTNVYNILLVTALGEEENVSSEEEIISNLLSLMNIQDVKIPTIEEDYLEFEIISSKKSVEKYLTAVYNAYEDNPNEFDYYQIYMEAQNANTTKIDELLENNRKIYYTLMNMKIPKKVLPLHKTYILSLQIDNSLLLSMKNYGNDPLMVAFNNDFKNSLSPALSDAIRLNLDMLNQEYNINYRYN